MSYDNTNSGILFKNDRKEGNQPDYKGSINVNGEDRWLSAWIKEGKNGKFMSLAVGDIKQSQAEQAKAAIREPGADDDFVDSDLPF